MTIEIAHGSFQLLVVLHQVTKKHSLIIAAVHTFEGDHGDNDDDDDDDFDKNNDDDDDDDDGDGDDDRNDDDDDLVRNEKLDSSLNEMIDRPYDGAPQLQDGE